MSNDYKGIFPTIFIQKKVCPTIIKDFKTTKKEKMACTIGGYTHYKEDERF